MSHDLTQPIRCPNCNRLSTGKILTRNGVPTLLIRCPSRKPSAAEQDALDRMFRAWDDLRSLGWKSTTPPNEGADFWSVTPSSTGVHYTSRSGDRFWIYDGDLWPAKDICLWREMVVAL